MASPESNRIGAGSRWSGRWPLSGYIGYHWASINYLRIQMSENTVEQDVMMVMRKVLASIIKDTTPQPGMRHPLSERTIQDVRKCLQLISARERELADAQGRAVEKPYYVDEPPKAQVVSIDSIEKPKKSDE